MTRYYQGAGATHRPSSGIESFGPGGGFGPPARPVPDSLQQRLDAGMQRNQAIEQQAMQRAHGRAQKMQNSINKTALADILAKLLRDPFGDTEGVVDPDGAPRVSGYVHEGSCDPHVPQVVLRKEWVQSSSATKCWLDQVMAAWDPSTQSPDFVNWTQVHKYFGLDVNDTLERYSRIGGASAPHTISDPFVMNPQIVSVRSAVDPMASPISQGGVLTVSISKQVALALATIRTDHLDQTVEVTNTRRRTGVRQVVATATAFTGGVVTPVKTKVGNLDPVGKPPGREKKGTVGRVLGPAFSRALTNLTEGVDLVNVAYNALEDGCKLKGNPSFRRKAAQVAGNVGCINVDAFIEGVILNEIEDRAFGTAGRAAGQFGAVTGRPFGAGTGPAL